MAHFDATDRVVEVGCGLHPAACGVAAIKAATGYVEENLTMFGPLRRVRSMTDEQIALPRRLPRRAIQARHPALSRVVWPTVQGGLLGDRGVGLQAERERFSPYLYAIGRAPEATS